MGKWGKAIRRRALSHCILEKQKLHSSDFVNYKFWYIRKELHSILLHSSSPSSPSRHCYYCRVLNCASSSCVPSQFASYRIQINFRSGFASCFSMFNVVFRWWQWKFSWTRHKRAGGETRVNVRMSNWLNNCFTYKNTWFNSKFVLHWKTIWLHIWRL